MNPRSPLASPGYPMDFPNLHFQGLIFNRSTGRRPFQSRMAAAGETPKTRQRVETAYTVVQGPSTSMPRVSGCASALVEPMRGCRPVELQTVGPKRIKPDALKTTRPKDARRFGTPSPLAAVRLTPLLPAFPDLRPWFRWKRSWSQKRPQATCPQECTKAFVCRKCAGRWGNKRR